MSKTIKIIFTLSLLINIALIGLVAGGAYKRFNHHNIPNDIPVAAQEKIKANMKKSRDDMKAHFKQVRADREALKKVITAEEFSKQDYDAAIEKMLTKKSEMERLRADKMGDVLNELSQEDRQKISKRFLKSLSGKNKNGKKRGGKHGKRRPPEHREHPE